MQTRLAVTLTAALVISIGCTSPQPSQISPTPSQSAAVTAGCGAAADVLSSLDEFFGAFNRGDVVALSSLLSPGFYAYSVTLPDGHFVAWSTADANSHFLERYLAGDRFEFRGAQVTALEAWDGAAHFGPLRLVLTRDGAQIPLGGKGALFCSGRFKGLKVLALGAGL